MAKLKPILAGAAIPVIALGWFLFRPELLFVDHKVSETLPTASQIQTLRTGSFASYAHETTGNAALVQANGTTYVRLTDFKTSNGPDVHLYLVKGNDPQNVGGGFLDLGILKGNVGDQNYALPAGTDLDAYGSVAVWCKRFSVGFGGAMIPAPTKAAFNGAGFQLAGYRTEEIVVTHGAFSPLKGHASIVETGGKRFLSIANASAPKGTHVVLVKAETIKDSNTVATSTKIDLGLLTPGKKLQRFPISKEIDAWLYRSVSLWNGKKSLAAADLRSDQEHKTLSI